jgi:hypothetical protein
VERFANDVLASSARRTGRLDSSFIISVSRWADVRQQALPDG